MSLPKISVIVPVYKAEQHLPRCIESILTQTFSDFELLLINDGSPDNSGVICDEYSGRDVRVRTFHKVNGGVCSARNLGLDNAKGEWITFCDSDDWVTEKWLEDFMQNGGSSDFLSQGFYSDNYPGCKDGVLTLPGSDIMNSEIPAFVFEMISVFLLGFPWCKCFKKSIITDHNLRFNENFSWKEDEEFILRYIVHVKSIQHNFKSNYHYNFHEKKYTPQNHFELWVSIYNSIKVIFKSDAHLLMRIKNEYLIKWFLYSVYKMYEVKKLCKIDRTAHLNFIHKNFSSATYAKKADLKILLLLKLLALNASARDHLLKITFIIIRSLRKVKGKGVLPKHRYVLKVNS